MCARGRIPGQTAPGVSEKAVVAAQEAGVGKGRVSSAAAWLEAKRRRAAPRARSRGIENAREKNSLRCKGVQTRAINNLGK